MSNIDVSTFLHQMFGINPEKKHEMQKVVRVKPSDSSAFTFLLV